MIQIRLALLILFFSSSAWSQSSVNSTQTSATSNSSPATAEVNSAAEVVTPKAEDNKIKFAYNVIQEDRDMRFNVGIFWQISQFSLEGRSLEGAGPEVLMGYAMNPKLSVNFGVSQALDTANGLSALYTGIRTAAAWAVKGSAYGRKAILNVNGEPTYSVVRTHDPLLSVETGLEQIFFNGSTKVSPATGYSLGLRYDFSAWKVRVSTMARMGNLKISSEPVTLTIFGAGLLYRF